MMSAGTRAEPGHGEQRCGRGLFGADRRPGVLHVDGGGRLA
ncbi:hypothetical protein ABZW30_03505 [Kitasatospora sp. NPDC004669]